MKTAEFNYWLLLICHKLKQNRKSDNDAVHICVVELIV